MKPLAFKSVTTSGERRTSPVAPVGPAVAYVELEHDDVELLFAACEEAAATTCSNAPHYAALSVEFRKLLEEFRSSAREAR